jgi:hypothetical protein
MRFQRAVVVTKRKSYLGRRVAEARKTRRGGTPINSVLAGLWPWSWTRLPGFPVDAGGLGRGRDELTSSSHLAESSLEAHWKLTKGASWPWAPPTAATQGGQMSTQGTTDWMIGRVKPLCTWRELRDPCEDNPAPAAPNANRQQKTRSRLAVWLNGRLPDAE